MPGAFTIIFAALLASGTGGLIISCIKAPLWDSECEYLYLADAEGSTTQDGKRRHAEREKGEK